MPKDVNAAVATIKTKRTIQFVDWYLWHSNLETSQMPWMWWLFNSTFHGRSWWLKISLDEDQCTVYIYIYISYVCILYTYYILRTDIHRKFILHMHMLIHMLLRNPATSQSSHSWSFNGAISVKFCKDLQGLLEFIPGTIVNCESEAFLLLMEEILNHLDV